MPVPGRGEHDDVGLDLAKSLVIKTEGMHHSYCKVFHHNVADTHEVTEDLDGGGFPQVQCDAELPAILAIEGPATIPETLAWFVVRICGLPVRVQSCRRFDLDHLGAEVCQHPSRERYC